MTRNRPPGPYGDLVFCPECQAEGQKSTVLQGYCTSGEGGYSIFFDEEGHRHQHDTTVTTCFYECDRGHQFSQRSPHACWCGWVQETA